MADGGMVHTGRFSGPDSEAALHAGLVPDAGCPPVQLRRFAEPGRCQGFSEFLFVISRLCQVHSLASYSLSKPA